MALLAVGSKLAARCCLRSTVRNIRTSVGSLAPIKAGDKLPTVSLYEGSPTNKVNLAELFGNKKGVVFAVPGAFTPGCSKTHLPGYVEKAAELKAKGVEVIACVAVNDPFVMEAWGKVHNADGKELNDGRMAASLFDKFMVAVGLVVLIHAAYSAAQHRAYLRLTEKEFTTLPSDVLIQTLTGLVVACYGIVRVVGRFKEIRPVADLEGRTWDSMSTHVAFYNLNHRGKCLMSDAD